MDKFETTRTELPALRDPNVKIQIWTVLKENVGKDLSRITMPIYFNEPQSMLHKSIAFTEYIECVIKATKTTDKCL